MAEYWESDDLKEFAERLIANHHPNLGSAKIAYLMRDKAARRNLNYEGTEQQVVPGSATKMGRGKYEVLTGKDLVIEVGMDEWQQWSETQRNYVIDTLLSQLQGDEDSKSGDMRYFSIPYPVSVFPDVIKRHGMPFDELRDCFRVMREADTNANKTIVAGNASDSNGDDALGSSLMVD